jgi:hypothetical protein
MGFMLRRIFNVLLVAAVAAFLNGSAVIVMSAEWGSIIGRVIVVGTPQKPTPLSIAKDQFCQDNPPPNEVLVLGKKNELVNAVVYLRIADGDPNVAVHPDYDDGLKKLAVIDIQGCQFRPHVTIVRKGQELIIKDLDPVGHNADVPGLSFARMLPSDPETTLKVTTVGLQPMSVVCNIHPWMKGYVWSLDHPYAAITGQDGMFEIKNIPVGEHVFQFWHETGYLKDAPMKGGATDQRGRAKLKITNAKTLDLGDVRVRAGSIRID